MEYQQVLESFDSLWFFATRAPPRAVVSAAVDPPGEENATPICPNQQNVESNRVNGSGFGSEVRTEKKELKRRRNRRSKTLSFGERRKFEGEMDMCYAVKEICECLLFEQRIGIGYGNGNHNDQMKKKMPPFEDSMAMKEHIKSWAYAVACTVR